MDPPMRGQSKAQSAPRYWAPPASMLIFAMSLFLSILAAKGISLEGQILRPASPTLESFLTSHLLYTSGYHLAVTLLLLLVLGGVLEARWGTPMYLAFYLCAALGTAAVTVAAGTLGARGPSCGATGVVLGCLAAVGMLYSDHKLIWFLPPLKYLTWAAILLLAAGLALLDARAAPDRGFNLPQVSGVAFGLLFAAFEPAWERATQRWKERREKGRKERVVALSLRVDQLLEKISDSGLDSLTPEEKSFLRQASKHYKSLGS
jgi:membrane associated rhomboid family serine protease